MKILFLDIDGVLNSDRYDREKDRMKSGNIDETRLDLIKEIVDKTDAKIVLTSTWRHHWHPNEELCDDTGKELNRVFNAHGVEIFDKTPRLALFTDRSDEIKEWLEFCSEEIESFAILDDFMYGWGDLEPYFVKTSPQIGYGLEKNHAERIISILNK